MENNNVEIYGGKIMKSVFDNYTKDELQDILNRSHSFSEVLSYVGLSSNSGSGNYKTLHKIIDEYKLDVSKLNKNRKNNKNYSNHSNQEKSVYEYLINGITCSSYKLKNKLFAEGLKEKRCEICGITNWLGNEISFQLHHKDGNNTNNILPNLQILCPNCHSQTDNYAGKNIKTKMFYHCQRCGIIVSSKKSTYCKKCAAIVRYENQDTSLLYRDKEYLKAQINDRSYEDIGRQFGVSGNTIRKWCKKFELV